ncbi:MAG: hypothetical protein RLZZ299_513 [Pseudomonadota bacterium]
MAETTVQVLPSSAPGVRRALVRSDDGALAEVVEGVLPRAMSVPRGGVFAPWTVDGERMVLGAPLARTLASMRPSALVMLALVHRVLEDLDTLHAAGGVHGALHPDGWGVDAAGWFRVRPVLHVPPIAGTGWTGDVGAVGASLRGLLDLSEAEAAGAPRVGLWARGVAMIGERVSFGEARAARQALGAVLHGTDAEAMLAAWLDAGQVRLPVRARGFDVTRPEPVAPAGDVERDARAWVEREIARTRTERYVRLKQDVEARLAAARSQAEADRAARVRIIEAARSEQETVDRALRAARAERDSEARARLASMFHEASRSADETSPARDAAFSDGPDDATHALHVPGVLPSAADAMPPDAASPPSVEGDAPHVSDVSAPVTEDARPAEDALPSVEVDAMQVSDASPPAEDAGDASPAVEVDAMQVSDASPPAEDALPSVEIDAMQVSDASPPAEDASPAVADASVPAADVSPAVADASVPAADVSPTVETVPLSAGFVSAPVDVTRASVERPAAPSPDPHVAVVRVAVRGPDVERVVEVPAKPERGDPADTAFPPPAASLRVDRIPVIPVAPPPAVPPPAVPAAAPRAAAEPRVPPEPRVLPEPRVPAGPATPPLARPTWEGLPAVTGDPSRSAEKGAGKWTDAPASTPRPPVDLDAPVALDADAPGAPSWAGIGGVTGSSARMYEKGAGKWGDAEATARPEIRALVRDMGAAGPQELPERPMIDASPGRGIPVGVVIAVGAAAIAGLGWYLLALG